MFREYFLAKAGERKNFVSGSKLGGNEHRAYENQIESNRLMTKLIS